MATELRESKKSTSTRRSEDEMIADLQAKIDAVESRIKERESRSSPVAKDFERFKKQAARFVQACFDNGRGDVANSVLGVLNVVERQVKDV